MNYIISKKRFIHINYILLTIAVFAFIYYLLGKENFNNISYPTDYLYLSIITQSSIGYGDITPKSGLAKFFVSIQGVTTLIHIILLL